MFLKIGNLLVAQSEIAAVELIPGGDDVQVIFKRPLRGVANGETLVVNGPAARGLRHVFDPQQVIGGGEDQILCLDVERIGTLMAAESA